MALPLLEAASRSVRTFYPFAVRSVSEGLSANRTIDAFRAAGNAIRRADALSLIRAIREVESIGSRLQFINRLKRPDPAALPIALTKTRRDFGFTVQVEVRNLLSNFTERRFVTVSTDTLLTRAEIEEFAAEVAEDEAYGDELVTESAKLLYGFKSALLQ